MTRPPVSRAILLVFLCSTLLPGCRDWTDAAAVAAGRKVTWVDVQQSEAYLRWRSSHPVLDRELWTGTRCDSVQLWLQRYLPDPASVDPGRQESLNLIVDQTLIVVAAEKRGITAPETDVDLVLQRLERLGSDGAPLTRNSAMTGDRSLRDFIRGRLVTACYWKATVFDLVQVSDLDMLTFSQAHPGSMPADIDSTAFDRMRPILGPRLREIEATGAIDARLARLRRSVKIFHPAGAPTGS